MKQSLKENYIRFFGHLTEHDGLGRKKGILKEAQFTNKDLFKAITNPQDFGDDAAEHAYMKDGNVVVIDGFYYGEKRAMDSLIKYWKPGGTYYEYFKKEYGVDIKILDQFSELKARGRHKKLTPDGIVGVILTV